MGDSGIEIDVVIPAYNAERFLRRCLKSVFAQTLKPQKVFVVDDGSIDNTATLAAELGATVISRANGGLSAARNSGIKAASSEWIALLDADDMWAPEKLDRQAACVRPETVLVYTGTRIFDDDGIRNERPAIDVMLAKKRLQYCNPITPSTVLVRREMVMRDGGFREDILACEDWEMWVRLEREGQFEAVTDPLTDYYVHPKSLSANPERMLQALDRIIDTTLLVGRQGFDRWAWRRRIRATQLCSASLIARENGFDSEASYIFRSLQTWPSPLWQTGRYAVLVASMASKFFHPRRGLRTNSPGDIEATTDSHGTR
jgi:glycosyltransferase involved in cell wall biosynthesis